ncbi:MAG: hypothetical protein AB2693_20590 [Candidatus Thiodiazotropha sp.]
MSESKLTYHDPIIKPVSEDSHVSITHLENSLRRLRNFGKTYHLNNRLTHVKGGKVHWFK